MEQIYKAFSFLPYDRLIEVNFFEETGPSWGIIYASLYSYKCVNVKANRVFICSFYLSLHSEASHATYDIYCGLPLYYIQRSAKVFVRGCEKFIPALAYLFCPALPGSCLARFAYFFADLCIADRAHELHVVLSRVNGVAYLVIGNCDECDALTLCIECTLRRQR